MWYFLSRVKQPRNIFFFDQSSVAIHVELLRDPPNLASSHQCDPKTAVFCVTGCSSAVGPTKCSVIFLPSYLQLFHAERILYTKDPLMFQRETRALGGDKHLDFGECCHQITRKQPLLLGGPTPACPASQGTLVRWFW